MSRRVTIPHVAALDGLRGAAVAGVLLFHGGHLTGGYLGVDLFFVLSGFLITSLLLTESGSTGNVALGSFWARRARRLLPALGGVLVGVAVYCVVFAQPTELTQIRGDALATIGYVANWRAVFAGQDYFALFRTPSPLQHTWSLAIEEQFYVVWPLVFVGLLAWWKGNTPKAVLVTALVLGAASSALMASLYDPADVSRVYYGTDTRAAGVLIGAALAAALTIWGPVRRRVGRIAVEVAGVVGVVVLAIAWTQLDGQSSRLYHGGFLACGIAAVAVIAAATHPQRGPIGWTLSFKPLCALGLISYGVYLWHWPIDIVLNPARTGLTGWPLFVLQLAVTLTIALASYRLLEMPIRREAFSSRQLKALVPAAAAFLVLLAFLTTTGAQSSAIASTDDVGHSASPLKNEDVLLLGDSVAQSVAPGLIRQGLTVRDRAFPKCRLVRGSIRAPESSPWCGDAKLWNRMLKRNPKVVLLVFGTWDLYDVKPPRSTHWLVPGTNAWARYYANEVDRAVTILGATGATVVMPTIPYVEAPYGSHFSASDPSAFNPKRVRVANRVLRELGAKEPRQLSVPDLNRFLAPNGHYQGTLNDGPALRLDGVHFNNFGSDLVARWLVPQLGLAGALGHPRS